MGVDINPQPHYPFKFHQGDAVEFIKEHGHEFDVVHASPPCQANIAITKGNRGRGGWTDNHVNLIPATRAALDRLPARIITVIENGMTNQLRPDLVLCGLQFGLKVFRHRYFELNRPVPQPVHVTHRGHRVSGWRHGVRYDGDMVSVYGDGGGKGSVEQWQDAMGIHWTSSRHSLREAVPPTYTEYIGRHLVGGPS